MGDIGSPTHPYSHVLSIKTWVLKTWEVKLFLGERERKKKEEEVERGGEQIEEGERIRGEEVGRILERKGSQKCRGGGGGGVWEANKKRDRKEKKRGRREKKKRGKEEEKGGG